MDLATPKAGRTGMEARMTTICTDGKTIAGDGLATWGDRPVDRSEQKIKVVENVIYALAGALAVLPSLIEWHQEGAKPNDVPPQLHSDVTWTLLVIDKDGTKMYNSKCPYGSAMFSPCAIGCGSEYAIGALHCGKSPREAVEIAAKCDIYTGGTIQVVNIAEALGIVKPNGESVHENRWYAPVATNRA